MSIEEKYYIPTLEEFKIGFPYEYNAKSLKRKTLGFLAHNLDWVSEEFTASCDYDGCTEIRDIEVL